MVTIPARYNGPEHSGNGGYVCGLLADQLDTDEPVTSMLRLPPPLDVPLAWERAGHEVRLETHGGALIGTASPGAFERDPLPFPDADTVDAGLAAYPGFHAHPFDRCFTCGTAREEGDGLRLFTGPVGSDRTAGPWHVHPGLTSQGVVSTPVVISSPAALKSRSAGCKGIPPATGVTRTVSVPAAVPAFKNWRRSMVMVMTCPSSGGLGCALDGRADALLCAATAQVAIERFVDLSVAWVAVLGEQRGACHHHAVGAVAALNGLCIDEGLLNAAGLAVDHQAFEGGDRSPLDGGNRNRAGPHDLAIEMDGTGAALREPAAELRSIEL